MGSTEKSREETEDLLAELIDRYGDPPAPVMNLLNIAYLRALAGRCGIAEIRQTDRELLFLFDENAQPDFPAITELIASSKREMSLSAGNRIALVLKTRGFSDAAILDAACRTLESLEKRQENAIHEKFS